MEICPTCGLPTQACVCGEIAKTSQVIEVTTEKRRFGKVSTMISGFDDGIDIKDVAKKLKAKRACGGTIKKQSNWATREPQRKHKTNTGFNGFQRRTNKRIKMAKKKTTTKEKERNSGNYEQKKKETKIKTRGRTFEGEVIRKHHKRITIQFERMIKIPKYERYEKRRTKLHARLQEQEKDNVEIGDRVEIAETRPISKTIHFIYTKTIRKGGKTQWEQ